MKARAKVLETHLHKLWKRKVPKKKPVSTSTAATTSSTTLAAKPTPGVADNGDDETLEDPVEVEIDGFEEDGEQIPIVEEATRPPKYEHEEL